MRRRWCVPVAALAVAGGSMLAMAGVAVVGGSMLTATGAAATTGPAATRPGHVLVRSGGVAGHLVTPRSGHTRLRHATSANWSGYAVHSGTYHSVSASWTEPTGKCSSGNGYSSFWVGLDGYRSDTVEQTGTDTDCHGGRPSYYGWYEMYPANSVRIAHPVKPGDKLSASVTYDGGGRFTLRLTDSTQGWTATETRSLTSAPRTSAEVIIEAPSSERGELPLADFGTVHLSACKVDGTSLGSLHPTKIIMVDGRKRLDKVSAVSGGGFSATWLNR